MKAYLFGSIFYGKDIMYNEMLAQGIRQAWPRIDMYVPQEAPFNNKSTFGDSRIIYEGDYNRLKDTDLLIGCLDGDIPPIGSVTECRIFNALAKNDPNKHMIVLHTDTRDAAFTSSEEKNKDMEINQISSQYNYFNLFTKGAIEDCGVIVRTPEQLFEYVHSLYLEEKRNNHFSGIYKITNRVNNKFYIGQSIDVLQRINQHFMSRNSKRNNIIDRAISKYGIENFTCEILEKCDREVLGEREKYWANEYYKCQSYSPYGYNLSQCGDQKGAHGSVVSCYNDEGLLIRTFPSYMEAARYFNCNKEQIREAVNTNIHTKGYRWRLGFEEDIGFYVPNPKKNLPIDIYDSELNLIASCNSIAEASNFSKVSCGKISTSLNTGVLIKGLYYFCEHMDDIDDQKNFFEKVENCNGEGKNRKYYFYDKETRVYKGFYVNLENACKELGYNENSKATIHRACCGKQNYGLGYIWSYQKFDIIPANYRQMNIEYYQKIQ